MLFEIFDLIDTIVTDVAGFMDDICDTGSSTNNYNTSRRIVSASSKRRAFSNTDAINKASNSTQKKPALDRVANILEKDSLKINNPKDLL